MGSIELPLREHVNGGGNPKRYPDTGISIIVVGGGIGGLTCALECWRKGHQVQVLERSRAENLLGDSLTVGPTAVKILERNWPELHKHFDDESYHPEIAYYKFNGEKIFGPAPFEWNPGKAHADPDAPKKIDRHTRPDLHHALLLQLHRCAIPITYDAKADSYFEDTTLRQGGVILSSGARLTADLIVAADGIHTKSWHLIGGTAPDARPSGNSIFRTSFPVSHMLADPILVAHLPLQANSACSPIQMWMGPGSHGVMWRTDRIFSYALYHKDTGRAEESWSNHVDPSVVLAEIKRNNWSDIWERAVAVTPKDALIDWPLIFRDSQPTWMSHGGHVVQLGDAAHTFLPSSGNGATQAMEDATSLATCLSLAGGKEGISTAVAVHCKLRFERVDCLQLLGFVNQFSRHQTDWEEARKNPDVVKPRFGKWMWDHDPERYVVENWGACREGMVGGREFRNSNTPKGYTYEKWTLDDMLRTEKEGRKIELRGEWY